MPNSKTAIKRHRQNLKQRIRNRSTRSRVRTSIKAFETAVAKKEKLVAEARFSEFVKLIDTAAGNGLYHRNTAARKKSRLHKKLAVLTQV
ncbi:30S ribosomal protein S20 [Alkalispirochaeta odontotermitis]|nr:30S ribosomal protein S20 [Alkalispirochaeta odontotermitis]